MLACLLACLFGLTIYLIQTFTRPCAAHTSAHSLAQQYNLQFRGLLADNNARCFKETRSEDESSGSTHGNLRKCSLDEEGIKLMLSGESEDCLHNVQSTT